MISGSLKTSVQSDDQLPKYTRFSWISNCMLRLRGGPHQKRVQKVFSEWKFPCYNICFREAKLPTSARLLYNNIVLVYSSNPVKKDYVHFHFHVTVFISSAFIYYFAMTFASVESPRRPMNDLQIASLHEKFFVKVKRTFWSTPQSYIECFKWYCGLMILT